MNAEEHDDLQKLSDNLAISITSLLDDVTSTSGPIARDIANCVELADRLKTVIGQIAEDHTVSFLKFS